MNMVALGIDDDGCHEDILNERTWGRKYSRCGSGSGSGSELKNYKVGT